MDDVGDVWISPDSIIKKKVVKAGNVGYKPYEDSECLIDIPEIEKYKMCKYVIGQSDDNFERLLDIVLGVMRQGEHSEVTFQLSANETVTFNLCLINFKSRGFIYEWDANRKYKLAKQHKECGVSLFKNNRYIDASHRFSKALKLLCSIPIPVDVPPIEVDGLKVTDIDNLKANLYNNHASCYLKHKDYETVIDLCEKVLKIDDINTKALYKLGVACFEVKDFDRSYEVLSSLLELDPGNKAAIEKLKYVSAKVNHANAKLNAIFKKMFV